MYFQLMPWTRIASLQQTSVVQATVAGDRSKSVHRIISDPTNRWRMKHQEEEPSGSGKEQIKRSRAN